MQFAQASSSKVAHNTADKPRKIWWLVGAVLLMLCILVQMPAVWLVNKFMPNASYLQYVSGNIWQGSAVVQQPVSGSAQAGKMPLSATVTWQWRPLSLFIGKIGADVEISSGLTQLNGRMSRGFNSWQVSDLSGKIDKQTLAAVVNWQLPDAPIQVNNLSLVHHKEAGFTDANGQLTWAGGQLGYPSGARTFNIAMPAMRADISADEREGASVLHANLVNNNSKRLGDLYLDAEGMVDVNLTQRLLENMPDYNGSAPADSSVVSVRQPLLESVGGGR